jgi:hypothetical protein
MCVGVFEQKMLLGSPEWRVSKEGGSENIFFYSYVLVGKSDATVFPHPLFFTFRQKAV